MPAGRLQDTQMRALGFWEETVLTDGTTGADLITNTVLTRHADLRFSRRAGLQVVNDGATDFTFTVRGSLDGTNFALVAYGTGSSAAYTQAALTVAAGAKAMLFLPDADLLGYVAVLPSAVPAAGARVVAFGGA